MAGTWNQGLRTASFVCLCCTFLHLLQSAAASPRPLHLESRPAGSHGIAIPRLDAFRNRASLRAPDVKAAQQAAHIHESTWDVSSSEKEVSVFYDPYLGLTHDSLTSNEQGPLSIIGVRAASQPVSESADQILRQLGVDTESRLVSPRMREHPDARSIDDTGLAPVSRQKDDVELISGTKSSFEVSYSPNFPQKARSAMKSAVKIWANVFPSDISIRVHSDWTSFSGQTLAATVSPYFIPGNVQGVSNLSDDTLYGAVVASSITGDDFVPADEAHVTVGFNSQVLWNFDNQRRASDFEWDFVTVAVHELCHGLFFGGVIKVDVDTQSASLVPPSPSKSRFDVFLATRGETSIVDSCDSSERELYQALTTEGVSFYDGSLSGFEIKFGLYSPRPFVRGSSTYHFDPETLDADCKRIGILDSMCSDLMTPSLPSGYTQRSIGAPTLLVMNIILGRSKGAPAGPCA